jgi:hypothetical protein
LIKEEEWMHNVHFSKVTTCLGSERVSLETRNIIIIDHILTLTFAFLTFIVFIKNKIYKFI